jgi:hypothetical protein
MTPYLSFLLAPFVELLQLPSDPAHPFGPEQLSVVEALSKSMSVDEGGTCEMPYHPTDPLTV